LQLIKKSVQGSFALYLCSGLKQFLAKVKASSTDKLLYSLPRKDAAADLCSGEFKVAYCHDLQKNYNNHHSNQMSINCIHNISKLCLSSSWQLSGSAAVTHYDRSIYYIYQSAPKIIAEKITSAVCINVKYVNIDCLYCKLKI
jgi:hypothetical protein